MSISQIFENISHLLQIQSGPSHRSRNYQKAADIIRDLTDESGHEISFLQNLTETDRLEQVRGIGKSTATKIVEIIQTGTCQLYEDLKSKVGEGVLDLLRVRGIGIKTASRLYQLAEVKSLADLRSSIDTGKLKEIRGLGIKTLKSIDSSLAYLESVQNLKPLGDVKPLADGLMDLLQTCSAIERVEVTGEYRRGKEMLSRLDLLVIGDAEAIQQALTDRIEIEIITEEVVTGTVDRFPVHIYCTDHSTFAWDWLQTTGPLRHIEQLGLTESSYRTEADIYDNVDLPYIAPELRRSTRLSDSIKAAKISPNLVTIADILADLHMHTDWSDGLNTVQEMVNGAKDLGYHYLAITDHSRSSAIANGLSTERLKAQIDTVKVITSKTEGITVLTGSEVDILKDGRLDFADELLAELDVVIASVHSVFEMSQVQMTKRIIRAIENPFTMMIGHPTGRLLGSRPGYAVDLSAVIDAAADHGVALEINASPYRLDLESDAVMEAKSKGVMLSVNTDAHAVSNLNQMPLGITTARRGWLESANLINTLSLDDFRRWKNRCQKL